MCSLSWICATAEVVPQCSTNSAFVSSFYYTVESYSLYGSLSFLDPGQGTTEALFASHPVFWLLSGQSLVTVLLYFSFNLFFHSMSPIHKVHLQFCSCPPVASLSLSPWQHPQSVRIIFSPSPYINENKNYDWIQNIKLCGAMCVVSCQFYTLLFWMWFSSIVLQSIRLIQTIFP